MKIKPTPGQWATNGLQITAGNVLLASMGHFVPEPERRANAALMTAAPALLAALKAALPGLRREFLALAEKYAGTPFESDPAYRACEARFRKAEAAIAAAEVRA